MPQVKYIARHLRLMYYSLILFRMRRKLKVELSDM